MRFLRDSQGKRSGTWTMLVIGFVVCNIKFLLSGLFHIPEFSGMDYAAALTSLGALYQSSKYMRSKHPEPEIITQEPIE